MPLDARKVTPQDLLPDAEFSMAARKAGRSYTDTVSEIVDLALARYGAKS